MRGDQLQQKDQCEQSYPNNDDRGLEPFAVSVLKSWDHVASLVDSLLPCFKLQKGSVLSPDAKKTESFGRSLKVEHLHVQLIKQQNSA